MNYWNNPIKTYTHTVLPHPLDTDPIVKSSHQDQHMLFWDSQFDHKQIVYTQRLQDLCNWANNRQEDFLTNADNHYDIANLVKLNMWHRSIYSQGIIKPMLISYDGDYTCATGESRLRVLEGIPGITSVTAFINTHSRHADKFAHLEPVINFEQYYNLCKTVVGTQFQFRFTDVKAPWGLDWYEYDSDKTRAVTPGTDYCVKAITEYLELHPHTEFTITWFGKSINWHQYKNY